MSSYGVAVGIDVHVDTWASGARPASTSSIESLALPWPVPAG